VTNLPIYLGEVTSRHAYLWSQYDIYVMRQHGV